MSFSIAETINRLLAPEHKISCSLVLWCRLLFSLRRDGKRKSRESGAFLLGVHRKDGSFRILGFIPYTDLDPLCLNSGIIRFDGSKFGKLWEICRDRNLSVIADVHVHPGGSEQSVSDRTHPMISVAGHLALIMPNFVQLPLSKKNIGIYQYLGGGRWYTVPRSSREKFLFIGF